MTTHRVYPDWFCEDGHLRWSVDDGDHRRQIRVDEFRLVGVSAAGAVDPAWTRDEAREADAPKCWLAVEHSALRLVERDGRKVALLFDGTGPGQPGNPLSDFDRGVMFPWELP